MWPILSASLQWNKRRLGDRPSMTKMSEKPIFDTKIQHISLQTMKTKTVGGSPTLPTPAQPRARFAQSGRGRAELLQALWLAEQHALAEDGLAHAAGYAVDVDVSSILDDDEAELNIKVSKRAAPVLGETIATPNPASTSSQPSTADNTAKMRARFWAVTERVQLLPSPTVENERAKLPLRLEEVMITSSQPALAKSPIVNQARLMPAAKRNLQSSRRAGLDIAQLIACLSQAKTLRRLPRKKMQGWAERLLVVLDISEALAPFREDMFAFVGHLQRWIGRSNLQVRIIADERYPAGNWLDWIDGPEQAADWQRFGNGWPILLISELGLYANDSGHCKRAWAEFLQRLRQQGAALQVWCPLPLGEAGQRELPAVPVVHWSAASRMRQQPLPAAELHRSATRLQLAEDLCTLLANCCYIESQLLRRMRAVLGAAALDAGIEQLVWNHPALSAHPHALSLRAAHLDEYRQRFSALPQTQQRQALHILHRQHMQINPLLAHVEALTWAAQVGEVGNGAEQALVDAAQTVVAQLAYQPWQLQQIASSDILAFMQRFVHGADLRTRQFCSASMSKMLVALHRAKYGDEEMHGSLPGLREADMARALGEAKELAPYWLGIDAENGWLRLFSQMPARQFLLLAEPLMLASAVIEMAGKARWAMAESTRDIAVARLPWGEAETIIDDYFKHFYAPFAPPLVDGQIYVEAGNERLKIEEVERPHWALEWGRDRDGLYALVPNPWSAPRKLHYPVWLTPNQIYAEFMPLKQGKKTKKAKLLQLQLALDEIGLYAEFTIQAANGEHRQILRYIPPGQFLMGSPESELDRSDDEGPQHQVTISQGFWLADTACTQGLWQAIMGSNPSHFDEKNRGSAQHPVENVSWDVVQIFLQKLASMLPSCQPSLPTEAEWEYACRAGTTSPFSFGATISTNQVNYAGNYRYGDVERSIDRRQTVAVKALPANSWGLYQMHGNVWEWCADAPRDYSVDAVVDPGLLEEVDVKNLRVLHGGCWIYDAQLARSAFRYKLGPVRRFNDVGFRFVLRSSR